MAPTLEYKSVDSPKSLSFWTCEVFILKLGTEKRCAFRHRILYWSAWVSVPVLYECIPWEATESDNPSPWVPATFVRAK